MPITPGMLLAMIKKTDSRLQKEISEMKKDIEDLKGKTSPDEVRDNGRPV